LQSRITILQYMENSYQFQSAFINELFDDNSTFVPVIYPRSLSGRLCFFQTLIESISDPLNATVESLGGWLGFKATLLPKLSGNIHARLQERQCAQVKEKRLFSQNAILGQLLILSGRIMKSIQGPNAIHLGVPKLGDHVRLMGSIFYCLQNGILLWVGFQSTTSFARGRIVEANQRRIVPP